MTEIQERSFAELRRKRQWILSLVLCITTTAATVLSPFAPFAAVIIIWLLNGAPTPVATKPLEPQFVSTSPTKEEVNTSPKFRLYRQQELIRVVASLKADASILIVGEEGSGKTVLKEAVVQQLTDDGFTVGAIELASTKEMLLNLCEQLGIDSYSLEGKNLTIDGLKNAIARFFQRETAFLIVDDAHGLPNQFRVWLKDLKHQGVPMLLLATNPPRSDVFLSLPRVELKPLPEYAIRELMEQAALERGIQLDNHQMARLQERAGSNPMLAVRVIDEEYLGLDIEGGDHHRYVDGTPLLLLVGIIFVVFRFIGLGTSNQALYIFGGIAAAVFLGVSRLLYSLPKDSRRIK